MPLVQDDQGYAWVIDGYDGMGEPNESTDPNWPGVFFTFTANDNAFPVANAGEDQHEWLGHVGGDPNAVTITLDGSGSTDDGLPIPPGSLTYTWEQTGGPEVLTDPVEGAVQVLELTELAGNYEYDVDSAPYAFQLTVDDGEYTDTDIVIVTVSRDSCYASQEAEEFFVFGDITNAYGITTEGGQNVPDCKTDMYDLAEVALNWLLCTNIYESCD